MYRARVQGRNAQSQQDSRRALKVLRELYRDIREVELNEDMKSHLLSKVESVANILKGSNAADNASHSASEVKP